MPPEIKDPVLLHAPTRKSVACFGAVSLESGKFVRALCDKFGAATFERFLKKLLRHRTRGKRMVLVLDNARSGIPWEMLPSALGCGSGMTCWRRLRAWQAAGVWERLHRLLLARLRTADRIDFSRAIADSSSIRAVGAGKKRDRTQPIAVNRARNTTFPPTRRAFR